MIPGIVAGQRRGSSGVTARAFRIYVTQRSQSGAGTTAAGYMNISTGLASVVGGENICHNGSDGLIAGATANTSSYYTTSYDGIKSWSDARGAGGTGGSFWHTNNVAAPWWVSIDFGVGVTKTVKEVFIQPINALPDSRTPYTFQFQTSPDNVNWTTVMTVSAVTGWALNVVKAWQIP